MTHRGRATMNTQTELFDAAQRTGCVSSSGWQPGSGGAEIVTDKADARTLFEGGVADAADEDRAAAARSQPARAAKPPAKRADLLQRFAARLERHREELVTWIVRECESIRRKGEFEVGASIREALTPCRTEEEAAALANLSECGLVASLFTP